MGKLHHLDVGCADASLISTPKSVFLIDCHEIDRYSHLLPISKRLQGVFITHQHRDHYSGLEYLRNKGYSIEYLIFSPYERRYGDNSVTLEEWNEFAGHRDYFEKKGAKLYAPYRQTSFKKPWWRRDGISFWLLGPAPSVATQATRELHDACLVIKTHLNKRKCCFTGDASDLNLEYIATNTSHYCDDILHASHHGSMKGAYLDFVKGCHADYTVISTKPGRHDNVPHPTALKRYADNTAKRVYRTDNDGSILWEF